MATQNTAPKRTPKAAANAEPNAAAKARQKSVARSTKLGPEERAAAISRLKEKELDILVVGAGIVGAGAALDAVTRGLSTGLLEARDFASGTSSRSSKLIHGGIRYLEQLDFHLVREALIERGLLLQRIAPHLVKPVRFLYPLKKRVTERFYVGAGMMLYDIFSYTGPLRPGVPHHRHLSKRQVLRASPSISSNFLVGGLTYYDAQMDDARYVSTLARTASSYGAHVASRVNVEGFIKVGERVVGVRAHDLETGERFEVRAKQVVNATGVWTDDTQRMVGERGTFKVRASKGVHLVVPRDRFQSNSGFSSAPRRACCSSSRGAATGSSARPTPTGTSTRRTPPRRPPTSTTSSSTSTRCSPCRSRAKTSRACTRASARSSRARATRRRSSLVSTSSPTRCRGSSSSRAASSRPIG
ncbi:glycerol-3-phosphate dehydrogenase/oxidase [Agromyces protaetiae]|uniref:glycerol-3-phosphate dehydrogenase/oxidase n=1 Tax=Agromyces protaetiae TaxID=2509455 RepID=UPI00312C96BA